MPRQLLLLELNEVNFDFVEAYVAQGKLPVLGALIRRHGLSRTTSEESYERLEPWIQWVTAHTGRSFAEHQVFRLGDIVTHDIPQIWEVLEQHGLKVGAISPMNAKHRLRDPSFFVPDPWTKTDVTGGTALRKLYEAICQIVNDNAASTITPTALRWLALAALRYVRTQSYALAASLALQSTFKSWCKALLLDLLLSEVFIHEVRRSSPQFASLFLNAAAHIQHHYMFCAAPYEGPHRNPKWYVRDGMDPVLESYHLYDRMVGNVCRAFPRARLMLATGLHQDPHPRSTFYWRLKDHSNFLRAAGVPFVSVEPRMSRDFLITCEDAPTAARAAEILNSATAGDGMQLFEVDNRGSDLFVMLTYSREITSTTGWTVLGREHRDLRQHVVFVALKNGQHNGVGYFLDTGTSRDTIRHQESVFPLKEIPARILEAFGLPAMQLSDTSAAFCTDTTR
jgi:hypothetical protein